MGRQEPASGGVHDPWSGWTQEEKDEWTERVRQVKRRGPPQQQRMPRMGLYDKRGRPEPMDFDTAQALASVVNDVDQWGGNSSAGLWQSDGGVKRFTDRQLGIQKDMLAKQAPRLLVSDMPDDPSGCWDQHRCPLAAWPMADKWLYVKDLVQRHRGEVREISGEWVEVPQAFPEEDRFHHPQFCLTDALSKALTPFTGKPGKGGGKGKKSEKKGKEDDHGSWREEWSNTIVMADQETDAKHWRRDARCFGLAELFQRFGDRYNAKQLYRYYTANRILVHKRHRGKSAPERVAATQLRWKETGRYGFGRDANG